MGIKGPKNRCFGDEKQVFFGNFFIQTGWVTKPLKNGLFWGFLGCFDEFPCTREFCPEWGLILCIIRNYVIFSGLPGIAILYVK
jgi:hypothetical protein